MSLRLIVSCVLLACLSSVALADVVPQGKDADTKSGDAKQDAPLEQQLLDDLGADLLDDLKSAGGVKPEKGKAGKRRTGAFKELVQPGGRGRVVVGRCHGGGDRGLGAGL